MDDGLGNSQNGESAMPAEERQRKRWINGEWQSWEEWDEKLRQAQLRHEAYMQEQHEKWLQTEQGKLCLEFYRKFQEYEKYVESHHYTRQRPDGGKLEFVEHQLFEHGLKVMREYDRSRALKDRRNLERARRAARCEHRHADGRRCGSPRIKGKTLCYMHEQAEAVREATKIDLGLMEDPASIQLAIVRLQRGILDGLIDPRQSGMLAYLIQLATANVKNIKAAEHAAEEPELEQEDEKADEAELIDAKMTESLLNGCLADFETRAGELPESGT